MSAPPIPPQPFVFASTPALRDSAMARAVDAADRPGAPLPQVLIVDDNHDAAESLGILVEMLGATAEVVHDGAQALAAVQRQPPALVLLDIGMPDMDGYEVTRHMRALPGGEALFIVALTGWGQDSDQARSMAAGFDHHLVKPVDMRMLEALLNTLA